jgi:hypothetical protein
MNQNPTNPPDPSDVEMVIIKMSKDIEYLKEKVYELETNKLAEHFQMPPIDVQEQFMSDPPNKLGLAKGYRPLLESEIKDAIEHCSCMAGAARYLKVSFKTFKKYAKRFNVYKPDPKGTGAKTREPSVYKGKYPLDKIISGEICHPDPRRFKEMLFKGGKRERKCERCGFREARPDGVQPLVINFIDGDSKNQRLENVKIYCYNCTFILRGYIRRGIVVFDTLPMQ